MGQKFLRHLGLELAPSWFLATVHRHSIIPGHVPGYYYLCWKSFDLSIDVGTLDHWISIKRFFQKILGISYPFYYQASGQTIQHLTTTLFGAMLQSLYTLKQIDITMLELWITVSGFRGLARKSFGRWVKINGEKCAAAKFKAKY